MIHYTQTIRDQYPKEAYDLNIQSVKFSSGATFDSAIGVCFQGQLGSWLFSLQGGKDKKVSESNLCLQLACRQLGITLAM